MTEVTMALFGRKNEMPTPESALPGRDDKMPVPAGHFVNGHPLEPPFPDGLELAMFGLGCFWGAERKFWEAGRVHDGRRLRRRLHAEPDVPRGVQRAHRSHRGRARGVRPDPITYDALLKVFWESHNPTQGMRQGNDVGTQYRSGIYWFSDAQLDGGRSVARHVPGACCSRRGYGDDHDRDPAGARFYYAEEYHQQYLAKNPGGYCGLGGTGLSCPVGLADAG